MRRENTKTNNTNGTKPEIFHLTRSNQREVTASFDDPTLSTCGGLAMLKEAERNCGIISEIAAVMQDWRKRWLVQHPLEEMLHQRVAQIACGYEDADLPKTARMGAAHGRVGVASSLPTSLFF